MEHDSDLFQQVEAVATTLLTLREQFIQVVAELQEPGIPPSAELIQQQLTARDTFRQVRDAVVGYAQSLGVLAAEGADNFTTIHSLKATLQATQEVEARRREQEIIRQQALEILNKIPRIVHRETTEFPALRQCYAQASELRNVIVATSMTEESSVMPSLVQGTHPLSALLMFVESYKELDDNQWEALHTTIAASFEPSLVTAARRQRLILQGEVPAQECNPSLVLHAEETDVVPPARRMGEDDLILPVSTPITNETVEKNEPPETQPAVIQGIKEQTAQTVFTAVLCETDVFHTVLSPQEVSVTTQDNVQEAEPESGQSPDGFGRTDTAQNIATAVLSGSIANRTLALRDLVWRLMYEDQLPLALHIVRYGDAPSAHLQPLLPSWLVHALALSRQMCHATGTLAQLLKNDFMHFDEKIFVPRHHEWSDALRFLLAAAALRPALLAPNTNAPRLLRTLRMKEGLQALWEYCEEVARYGEQMLPLDPNALKQAKDQAAWQAEMEDLRQQVTTWCTQAPTMTMVYAPATKVWCNWQESGGMIHSLLLPVRQNDVHRIADVKQQIDKFSDDAAVKNHIVYTDRKVLRRLRGEDITAKARGQLCAHVREAIKFARRWVNLHDVSTVQNQRKTYEQQQAEKIRQQVLRLQDDVLGELQSFEQHNPSLCISSSIAVCRRAVEDLRRLFDPHTTFLAEEPLVLHLLQVDFLRIPGMMLNDVWEPASSDSAHIPDSRRPEHRA